jgi:Chalcone isomerase-like
MRTLAALLCLASASVLLPTAAGAIEVADVQVPDVATAGGQPLVLNGAGIRWKFIVKVYVGALYLPRRTTEAATIVASDAPWRVTMVMKRDVSHEKIVDAFRDGFEKNSPGELPQHEASLKAWEAILEDLKEGQALVITYLPGSGTTLEAPGGRVATVPGQPFGAAILRNWLGPHPADDGLKRAMLGL